MYVILQDKFSKMISHVTLAKEKDTLGTKLQ